MENVVCCVCDAVGLSKPAETGRAVTGNCELVFREFVLPSISFVASCAAGERACRRARRLKKPIRAGERRNMK